jgi:DNA-binding XRE family transcriptional regulator
LRRHKKKMIGRKQTWLAKEIGMTDTALSNRINGVFPFKTNELWKIAAVLDDHSLVEYNILK